jgi:hypothetical protein
VLGDWNGSGGGGGGIVGGGGGGSDDFAGDQGAGGGGGGSGLAPGGTMADGVREGNGLVTLTWQVDPGCGDDPAPPTIPDPVIDPTTAGPVSGRPGFTG